MYVNFFDLTVKPINCNCHMSEGNSSRGGIQGVSCVDWRFRAWGERKEAYCESLWWNPGCLSLQKLKGFHFPQVSMLFLDLRPWNPSLGENKIIKDDILLTLCFCLTKSVLILGSSLTTKITVCLTLLTCSIWVCFFAAASVYLYPVSQ